VGARAGVSASTASRALRQDSRIAAATRRRVEEALRQLQAEAAADRRGEAGDGPAPGPVDPAAGGRAGGALIAVLVPEHPRPRPPSSVYLATLEAVREVAEARGVGVVVTSYTSAPGEHSFGDRLLRERSIAGAVVVRTHRQDERFEKLRASGVPFVVVNRVFADRFAPPHVGVDHREIGQQAAEYLLDLGHRRIVFARFVADVISLDLRFEGYAAALKARGLEVDERLVIEAPFTTEGARAVGRAFVARFWGAGSAPAARPTALLALSDRHAIAALHELRAAGLRVPEDVSLVGADDADEAADAGLTTVRVPWREMARGATESLLGILALRGVRRLSIVLDCRLVERRTSAPPGQAPAGAAPAAGEAGERPPALAAAPAGAAGSGGRARVRGSGRRVG
jgi:DNA-binding LacI/PurR family transcriptional regulator